MYGPTVHFHEMSHYRQPQAHPSLLVTAGISGGMCHDVLGRIERIEDVGQVLGCNSGALIFYGDTNVSSKLHARAESDRPAVRGEFYGVDDEILQHVAQLGPVDPKPRNIIARINYELLTATLHEWEAVQVNFLQEFGKNHVVVTEVALLPLPGKQFENGIDDLGQTMRLGTHRHNGFLQTLGILAVLQHPRHSHNIRHRRAEFVSRHSDKVRLEFIGLAEHSVGLLNAGEHRVEVVCQRVYLISTGQSPQTAAVPDTMRQVIINHTLGSGAEPTNTPDQPPLSHKYP